MKCHEVQEAMVDYILEDTSDQIAECMSGHLDKCADCRQWYEEVSDSYRAWTQPNHEDAGLTDLIPHVMSRVDQLDKEKGKSNHKDQRSIRYRTNKLAFYHYAVAASLTFVLLQTGMFQKITSDLSTLNFSMSYKVQTLFQLFSQL